VQPGETTLSGAGRENPHMDTSERPHIGIMQVISVKLILVWRCGSAVRWASTFSPQSRAEFASRHVATVCAAPDG
jgi:hypothetical protein